MPLHPVIARIIRQAYAKGHASLHLQPLAAVRQHYRQHFVAPAGLATGEDHYAKHCLLRLHRPLSQQKPLPVIVYIRASGYTIGELSDTDYYCQRLVEHSGCIVAAIEPRLCPEHKFPTSLLDCVDGVQYLHAQHQSLQINPRKIALWGDSSGGTLVAALSQLLKQDQLIQHQVLFYPMLDYYNEYPSKTLFQEGYLLDKSLCEWFAANVCRSAADRQDPRFSPLLAEDFSGLPNTTLIGAQYDRMRDEATCYIEKLVAAKVPVDAVYYPGMIHGFLWYSTLLDIPNHALRYALKQVLATFNRNVAG